MFAFSVSKAVFCMLFSFDFQANHTHKTVKASLITAVGSSIIALFNHSVLQ